MLDSLRIKNFRCFEDLEIESLGRVNLIVGKNNVGKSTLLEALTFFSTLSKTGTPRESLQAYANFLSFLSARRGLEKHLRDRLAQESAESILKQAKKQPLYIGDKSKKAFFLVDNQNPEEFTVNLENTRGQIGTLHFDKNINPEHDIDFPFITSGLKEEEDTGRAWDNIRMLKQVSAATDILKILEKEVESIYHTSTQMTMIDLESNKKSVPIKAMGEGMSRLLQIFLYAFQAQKNGLFMIDEFENGLHYSIQEEVWEHLFQLAEELDIQIFATTHSMDTIRSFSKITLKSPEQGRLVSLGRNTRQIDNGKITAITYNEDEIKVIAETGMEVR